MDEAPLHPHNRARSAFIELAGVAQPAPAPRFSRTPNDPPTPPQPSGEADPRAVLADWGLGAAAVEAAQAAGILARNSLA
jgi:alpha-methylacyl-CoA racemase